MFSLSITRIPVAFGAISDMKQLTGRPFSNLRIFSCDAGNVKSVFPKTCAPYCERRYILGLLVNDREIVCMHSHLNRINMQQIYADDKAFWFILHRAICV